jgi:hypothetical protein
LLFELVVGHGNKVATPSWIQSMRSQYIGQDGEEEGGERARERRDGAAEFKET